MKKYVFSLVIFFIFLFSVNGETVYRFGLFPIYNAKTMIEIFTPIAAEIERKTGNIVELVSAPSVDEFRQRIFNESYDIAWTNNSFYVDLFDKKFYRAVAAGYPEFRGVVMVRADSGIDSVEELEGKKIAAIAKHSIAGYLFLRDKMAEAGLYPSRDYSVTFIGDLESLPFRVINNEYNAAVFSEDNYLKSDIYNSIRPQLKIIDESIPIPQFPFVLHRSVDACFEKEMKDVLASITADSQEDRQVIDLLNIDGFRIISDDDYRDFRILYENINKYSVPSDIIYE